MGENTRPGRPGPSDDDDDDDDDDKGAVCTCVNRCHRKYHLCAVSSLHLVVLPAIFNIIIVFAIIIIINIIIIIIIGLNPI